MAERYAGANGDWDAIQWLDASAGSPAAKPIAGDAVYLNNKALTIAASPNVTFSLVRSGTAATPIGTGKITFNANNVTLAADTFICGGTNHLLNLTNSSYSATVTGSFLGGPGATAFCIYNSGAGTITVNGQVQGGTAGACVYNQGAGRIIINGNVMGSTGSATAYGVYNGNGHIIITCNIVPGACSSHAIYNAGSGSISVIGNVTGTASMFKCAIWNNSTGNVSVQGNVIGGKSTDAWTINNVSTGVCTIGGDTVVGDDASAYAFKNQSNAVVYLTGTNNSWSGATGPITTGFKLNCSAGDWSSSASWNGGSIPSNTDTAVIHCYQMVITNSIAQVAATTGVGYGSLVCATAGLTLCLGSITGEKANVLITSNLASPDVLTMTGTINASIGAYVLVNNGTGKIDFTGDVYGGSVMNTTSVYMATAGEICVTGNVYGGTAMGAIGITSISSGTIRVLGGGLVRGGTDINCNAISNGTGSVYITANILGWTMGTAILLNGACVMVVVGNITGGSGCSAHGLQCSASGVTLSITGDVVGGSHPTAFGINNASTSGVISLTGNLIYTATTCPMSGRSPVVTAGYNNYIQSNDGTKFPKQLPASKVLSGQVHGDRTGTVYEANAFRRLNRFV